MNTIIPHSSRFTQKTSTCELCPSPLRPSVYQYCTIVAIGDWTETRSKWLVIKLGAGAGVGALPGAAPLPHLFTAPLL